MSNRIIVFMDGSSDHCHKQHQFVTLSYGFIAHHSNKTVERYGCMDIEHKVHTREHELYAFIEAVKYIRSEGFDFKDAALYTDDQTFVHVVQKMLKQPDMVSATVFNLHERIRTFCRRYYTDDVAEDAIACMAASRLHLVKGHASTMDNLRVDYLARYARTKRANPKQKVMDYNQWLMARRAPFAQYIPFTDDAFKKASDYFHTIPENHLMRLSAFYENQISMERKATKNGFLATLVSMYTALGHAFQPAPGQEGYIALLSFELIYQWADKLTGLTMDDPRTHGLKPEAVVYALDRIIADIAPKVSDAAAAAQCLGLDTPQMHCFTDVFQNKIINRFSAYLMDQLSNDYPYPLLTLDEQVLQQPDFEALPG